MRQVRRVAVHSYNILNPSFAKAEEFPLCFAGHLDHDYRWGEVKNKLKASISSNAILCLQEVPQDWEDDLKQFFGNHQFDMVSAIYGQNRMGVAIAYPTNLYQIGNIDISVVSDTKRWAFQRPWDTFNHHNAYLFNPQLSGTGNNVDPWVVSRKRDNKMVSIQLMRKEKDGSGPFYVSTYHMPCVFRVPSVMVIHSALCAQHIQRISSGIPYILAGDFNIKPKSKMYKLLLEGKIPKESREYPPKHRRFDYNWQPTLSPMKSAYRTKLGREPEFTNLPGLNMSFCETLDYVFYSPNHWEVSEIVPLPSRRESPVMPNQKEPSDHLLIGATFHQKE